MKSSNSVKLHDEKIYNRFRQRVFTLLFIGYSNVQNQNIDFSQEDEESISGKLAQCIEDYLDSPESDRWVEKYSVYNECRYSPNGELGKKRKRLDIMLRSSEKKPALKFVFESKRLNCNTEPKDYFGEEGMQRFLKKTYPVSTKNEAAMLGYVQNHDTPYWIVWLQNHFEDCRDELHVLKKSSIETCTILPKIKDIFRTNHEPPTGKQIVLFHIFLKFLPLQ
jgi:hypothetical protein